MSSPRSRDWNVAQQIHSTESTQCELESPSYSLSAVKMLCQKRQQDAKGADVGSPPKRIRRVSSWRGTETGFKAPPQQP